MLGLVIGQAVAAGVHLVTTFDPLTHCNMCGDEHKLAQVLRNLLSNALKFTPKDGNVTVHTSCDSLARTVCVEVKDSGPGISKVTQEPSSIAQ